MVTATVELPLATTFSLMATFKAQRKFVSFAVPDPGTRLLDTTMLRGEGTATGVINAGKLASVATGV